MPSWFDRCQEIFILGPTAAGKDRLATELAAMLAASGRRAEVLAMDSMKIYRGLEQLADWPPATDRERVRWHLLGIVECSQSFNVARYCDAAQSAMAAIKAEGGIPIFVGGTTLYFKALVEGLIASPEADPEVRRRLEEEFESDRIGMHARLAAIDPRTAAKVHANDRRRVVRALEHHELSGRALGDATTAWQATDRPLDSLVQSGARRIFGVFPSWDLLLLRIEERAQALLARGVDSLAAEEVRNIEKHGGFTPQAAEALGVKELLALFAGAAPLDALITELIRRTRKLAKAQRTWFRSLDQVEWVQAGAGQPGGLSARELRARLDAAPAPASGRGSF